MKVGLRSLSPDRHAGTNTKIRGLSSAGNGELQDIYLLRNIAQHSTDRQQQNLRSQKASRDCQRSSPCLESNQDHQKFGIKIWRDNRYTTGAYNAQNNGHLDLSRGTALSWFSRSDIMAAVLIIGRFHRGITHLPGKRRGLGVTESPRPVQ